MAAQEERILVALELWPPDLDYRAETLRGAVEETNAAYLEDRNTIAVLQEGAVSDRTLIHELTHALQRQRWGPLPTPRTFEAQFLQLAWLEREARIVESSLPGAELALRDWPHGGFPREGPPAYYWFNEDPYRSTQPPRGSLGLGVGRVGAAGNASWGDRSRSPPADRTTGLLGPVGNTQIVGRRGAAWWVARILGPWPREVLHPPRAEHGFWLKDDRLEVVGEEVVWRLDCGDWAVGLVQAVQRARPRFALRRTGSVVEIRIPLASRQ